MKKVNPQKTKEFKELFYQEEFKGEKLLNNIRFFLAAFFIFTVVFKFKGFAIESTAFRFTMTCTVIYTLYAIILYFVYKKNIYHPSLKYVSVGIEMFLVLLNIYAYRLENYNESAKIFFVARYSIIFIAIYFSIYRYNFYLCLFAGLVGGLGYYFLIIRDNYILGMPFFFTGPDGNQYQSEFSNIEALFKVAYLIAAGLVTGFIALAIRKLVYESVTKEQDKNKILTEKKIVDAINNENKKYLDNITDGLLMIDKDYKILKQFSKQIVEIFMIDESIIPGMNFIDIIYPDKSTELKERKELDKFLSYVFNNSASEIEMIMQINPLVDKKITIIDRDYNIHEKIISVQFSRIYEKDIITNILIIIQDRTKIVQAQEKLKEEKFKRESEVEKIAAIIEMAPASLSHYIQDANNIIRKIENCINDNKLEKDINNIFRSVHSLKGTSKTIGFNMLSEISHKLEDIFTKFRDKKETFNNYSKQNIQNLLDELSAEVEDIKVIRKKFQDHSNVDLDTNSQKNWQSISATFFKSLKNSVSKLIEDTNKNIELVIDNKLSEMVYFNNLKDSIIQLVNNAVDHGIEDKIERLTQEKPENGTITLRLYKNLSDYIVEIWDDGRGIDFDQIRKKAIEKNLIKSNDPELTNLKLLMQLFKPGFSSKKNATLISGRGVGLDIVKDTINFLNGKISVKSKKGRGTKFILKIPVIHNN